MTGLVARVPARPASNHRTLAMQSRQDRLDCRVGQLATDGVADLARCEQPIGRPQRRQDLRIPGLQTAAASAQCTPYHVNSAPHASRRVAARPQRVLPR